MTSLRSRLSPRHLLALCTFLAPLLVLAALGSRELERQSELNQIAGGNAAREFAKSAAQALETQLDGQLQNLREAARTMLTTADVATAVRDLRDQGYSALLDIVLLDDSDTAVWPRPAPQTLSLPFARDPRSRSETGISFGLEAADLLLTTDHVAEACQLLQHLVQQIEQVEPATGSEPLRFRNDLPARFRLATALRHERRVVEAKAEFDKVRQAAFADRGFGPNEEYAALGLLAEVALAEFGDDAERLDLLERMAQDLAHDRRYNVLADPMLTAVTERLVDGIDDGELRRRATALLRTEQQRAQTRAFAPDCVRLLQGEKVRQPRSQGGRPHGVVQVIATRGVATTLLQVSDASAAEREHYPDATRIGLHVDLGTLLAPALESFLNHDRFVLAIDDPDGVPLVAAPSGVPEDYTPYAIQVRDLTVRAYPVDVAQLPARAAAQRQRRTVLLLALLGAAMAGALWLWQSVSKEAELARLKVELVSRVSHELKTPLALIRMYGETLELGRTRDEGQTMHFGGIIARESERLTSMIQRILDFSRQQAGTLRYTPREFDLGELVHRVADAYTPHLEARGAVLIDTTRTGVVVRCDESACESAIVNLLENAAKYGIEGDDEHEIEVDLRVQGAFAVFEVRDRGRGIPPGEQERIFDAFFRASNSGEVRGAGIGLSLVRHFARAHGGDIRAEPRDGGGTTFRLTLPLAGQRPADPPAPESA